MAGNATTYEIFAIRYATMQNRTASDNFLFVDDHAAPMPIDYFVWAIQGGGRTIVLDTGFTADVGARRGRTMIRTPAEALALVGVDAGEVPDVVLSHLHYDHAGGMPLFPKALFHVQDAEMRFATGRCMCHQVIRAAMEVGDVVEAVRHLYAGRLRFNDGFGTVAPGITVHLVGGHTGGLQILRVPTARGWVVLANDAAHYWANIRERRPFKLVVDVAAMLEGYRICEELADGPDHIIPGHDPLVLARFPQHGHPDVVSLHLPPGG